MRRLSLATLSTFVILALGCGFADLDGSAERTRAENAAQAREAIARTEQLEARVDALEERLAAQESAAKAKLPPSADDETRATELYDEAVAAMTKGDAATARRQLDTLERDYPKTRSGKRSERLRKELAVYGIAAPSDWGIERWFQGADNIDLGSSDPTLIVFWESWCPHCRRELPELNQTWEEYRGQGLQVIGLTKVSRSSTDSKVQEFIDDNDIGFPIAKEDGSASTHFAVSGIPAAAVLRDGVVVWRGHPGRITDEMLRGWL